MKKLKSISEFSKNAKMKTLNFSDMIYGGLANGRITYTGCDYTGPHGLHDCSDMDGDIGSAKESASDTPVK